MTVGRAMLASVALATLLLAACGGGGGATSSTPAVATPTFVPTTAATNTPTSPIGTLPTVIPTVAPTSGPVNTAAYTCPASSTVSTSVARGTSADATRFARRQPAAATAPKAALLAVTYDTATLTRSVQSVTTNEARAGATLVQSFAVASSGTTVHVVSVAAGAMRTAAAALGAQTGVKSVAASALPRYAETVSGPAYTNDPYFRGFTTTVAPTAGSTPPPPTFEVQPYVESAGVPGQWDMQAIRLAYAFAYATANNGSNVAAHAGALGSASVKIAIIDTGEDPNHPELSAKIAYQHCFITSPGGTQSTGSHAPDPQGHGTDVTGIAAAATNNGLGFAAAGGAVSVYAYRVFPTPDDSCATPDSTSDQCTTTSTDIASAIDDAVAQGVNVISMSLGGGTCVTPSAANPEGDPDPAEGAAVALAESKNIVVVAATGNAGTASTIAPVSAPACDTGVIAVGATALADGSPNASNVGSGSAGAPVEYVPTYSAVGSPASAPGSATAWGIVAPGGDPSGDDDADDLHWIENIWTTTPFDSKFAGGCAGDYPNDTGTADCRELIAGTSMATPHVAGAAALIIAAAPQYQSPALMKQLLCTTADDIGDPHEGCGRLNVYRAMAHALGDTSPP